MKKAWIAIVAIVLSISSASSFAAKSRSASSSSDANRRRLIAALLAAELAKSQTSVPSQTGAPQQAPVVPIVLGSPQAVERRNVTQVVPSLPSDALCNSRSDPATYLQCCEQKRAAGSLDATCAIYLQNGKLTN